MPRLLVAAPSRLERAAGHSPAARVAQTGIGTDNAHDLLERVGWLLVHGRPLERGDSYLLVAMRPRPTLLHFDPERIEYWAGADQPGALELTWPMPQASSTYSWGTIRIVDRVGASNGFVSFGGMLSVSRDGAVAAALFRSPAPILALHGRSGPADPLATHVVAFLARLRAASGNSTSVGQVIRRASPLTLYAAFLERTLAANAPGGGAAAASRFRSLLRMELLDLTAQSPIDVKAGLDLAATL